MYVSALDGEVKRTECCSHGYPDLPLKSDCRLSDLERKFCHCFRCLAIEEKLDGILQPLMCSGL